MATRDCYEVLGVDSAASVKDIKAAFRKLALKAHPDHGGDAQKFLELKGAFEEAIRKALSNRPEPAPMLGGYDPFADPLYDTYEFFEPENDSIARFERNVLASDCRFCHGLGVRSKLVDPSKGFMGIEERFCICQKVN